MDNFSSARASEEMPPVLESYGSEQEFIGKSSGNGGSEYGMQNNNNSGAKLILDALLKFSSLVVYPIFVVLIILYTQIAAIDMRQSLIEDRMQRPSPDVALSNDIAIIKDRQQLLMRTVEKQVDQVGTIRAELESHRLLTATDPGRKR